MDNNFDVNNNEGNNRTEEGHRPVLPSQSQPAPQYMTYSQMRGEGMNCSYPYQAAAENPFTVSSIERRNIKKNYFGTFMEALTHGIGAFVLAQIIFIVMMLCGYEFRYTEDNTAIVDWIYCLAASIPSVVFCIGIFIYDKFRSKSPLRSYLKPSGITAGTVIGFFGIVMFGYAVAMFAENVVSSVMFAAGVSPISEDYLTETDLTPAYLAAEFICSVILAPIGEELMFRGVILRRLSNVSQTFAIFVSAAIFGLMHGNILQTILGFTLGIVLGYAAVKTGSLLLPIAGHMFINAMSMSSEFVKYFLGAEASESFWMILMIVCFVVGLISIIVMGVRGKIRFPEYNDYHRKRTFPIMVSCVSFWIMLIYYVAEVVSACGPVTDKLME